jgi:CheY-like chemotaxis protein
MPRSLKILVVDDSQVVRRALRAIFRSRRWSVSEAEDGRSGVEKFRKCKADVVVLDLALPDIDGIKVAQEMSATDPEVPVILFTILDVAGIEATAERVGIRAIVPKAKAWNLLKSIEALLPTH